MIIVLIISLFGLTIFMNSIANKQVDNFEDYADKFMKEQKIEHTTKRESILESYLNKMKSLRSLSHKEEKELVKDIQNGNSEALERLVVANLDVVIDYIKEVNIHLHPDLINEGNIGLIESAKKYNGKGYFKNFAKTYIAKHVDEIIKDSNSYKYPYVEITRRGVCGTCLVNRNQTV